MPLERESDNLSGLEKWVIGVGREARAAKSLTVGLIGGSRRGIDRRVTDQLAKGLASELRASQPAPRLLVVRVDGEARRMPPDRLPGVDEPMPAVAPSPLGRWAFVEIPMPIGKTGSRTLQQLSRWLPKWKQEFGVILFDLGPMNLVPSRSLGRLCDSCYVVLGPDSCASPEWILQHIAWHERSGTQVCGTLVSALKHAA